MMINTDMLAWIKSGTISFPSPLLTHYKKMNLTEQELVLILHMISFMEKRSVFSYSFRDL